jgi:hypothetical protein
MKIDITKISTVLNKKELDRFGKFLSSPFFNTEDRFVKVFNVIKSEKENITREKIIRNLFGAGVSTTDARFRKLVSEFMALFERYLSEMEFEKDRYRRQMTLKQFAGRHLNGYYTRQKVEAEVRTTGIKDEKYYSQMLEYYSFRYKIENLITPRGRTTSRL